MRRKLKSIARRGPQRIGTGRSCRLPGFVAKAFWLAAALLMGAQQPSATAQEDLFAEIERLEMDAMNLALERYKFEGALLRPDEDELVVFFDLPQGISVVMNSIRLELDAKVVLDHRYRSGELEKFLRDSVQPLYVARIPNGRHVLRVRISALGGLGSNVPVLEYAFFKEPGPKFLYIALQGDTARSLRVTEW